ncbi:hypothetical protein [Limnoglobus roseus]|uniref:Uncharacterized protein n=1 Tax=Limnoglobus roseus TaxID=2598579 RepID=A0A5C1AEU3_9BACT|nr:hypothetical protein [Limnoglobus roseus]QEL15634.1 hypothetical protein PX52LOC_02567 [Limnoglobus roseus]
MSKRIPSYLFHKMSGQARVVMTRPDGTRHTIYLGPYGSAESKERYAEVIKGLSRGTPVEEVKATRSPATTRSLSVNEVILAYWRTARGTTRGRTASRRPN